MNSNQKPVYRFNLWSNVTALSLALGIVSISAWSPAIAQEQRIRTLNVTGNGIVHIPTTISQVRLGVEVQGKTVNEVQQDVAQRSQAVVNLLKSRNVEQLETTGINLNPVYSYENNVQTLTGYSANNMVSFRTNTENAGALIDEAVKAGATRVDGINFTATDDAIANAQKQALIAATQDAQKQADIVLSALNLTRREIINIAINNVQAISPLPVFANRAKLQNSPDAAITPVVGGQQKVEASVSLEISY